MSHLECCTSKKKIEPFGLHPGPTELQPAKLIQVLQRSASGILMPISVGGSLLKWNCQLAKAEANDISVN